MDKAVEIANWLILNLPPETRFLVLPGIVTITLTVILTTIFQKLPSPKNFWTKFLIAFLICIGISFTGYVAQYSYKINKYSFLEASLQSEDVSHLADGELNVAYDFNNKGITDVTLHSLKLLILKIHEPTEGPTISGNPLKPDESSSKKFVRDLWAAIYKTDRVSECNIKTASEWLILNTGNGNDFDSGPIQGEIMGPTTLDGASPLNYEKTLTSGKHQEVKAKFDFSKIVSAKIPGITICPIFVITDSDGGSRAIGCQGWTLTDLSHEGSSIGYDVVNWPGSVHRLLPKIDDEASCSSIVGGEADPIQKISAVESLHWWEYATAKGVHHAIY